MFGQYAREKSLILFVQHALTRSSILNVSVFLFNTMTIKVFYYILPFLCCAQSDLIVGLIL